MDNARLVLEYLDVLAWPLVVITALIVFRRSLRGAVARLTAFEGLGVKATLAEATEQARAVTGSAKRPSAGSTTGVPRFTPSSFLEAREFAEVYRSGSAVVVDLNSAPDVEAKRLIDFCAGLVFEAKGTLERIESKVFLLSQPAPPPKSRALA